MNNFKNPYIQCLIILSIIFFNLFILLPLWKGNHINLLRLFIMYMFVPGIFIYGMFNFYKSNIFNNKIHDMKIYYQVIFYLILVTMLVIYIGDIIAPNNIVIIKLLKPVSDLLGFIAIEKNINKIFNKNIKKHKNVYKVYNNWQYFTNNIIRRISNITLESKGNSIDFENPINNDKLIDFLADANNSDDNNLIPLLNIKEDVGILVWLLIFILMLYYISND